MRMLTLNINESLTDFLVENDLYICDVAEDFDDAHYHASVRYYNTIIVKDLEFLDVLKILRIVNPGKCAFVVLIENLTNDIEFTLLKSGALCVLDADCCDELILAKLESIHRENFAKTINYKNLIDLDQEKKCVLHKDQEMKIKGKSFDILSYLVKNRHRSPISKEELVGALWDEPELVCTNNIEVNINVIRKELKKNFNQDFIDTVRNRGYKIA